MWETVVHWPFRKEGQADGLSLGLLLFLSDSPSSTLTRAALVGGSEIMHWAPRVEAAFPHPLQTELKDPTAGEVTTP